MQEKEPMLLHGTSLLIYCTRMDCLDTVDFLLIHLLDILRSQYTIQCSIWFKFLVITIMLLLFMKEMTLTSTYGEVKVIRVLALLHGDLLMTDNLHKNRLLHSLLHSH